MEQQGDLVSLLSMFRRHWVTVLSVLAIGLVVAALALFLIKPVYTSAAVIYVSPSETNLLSSDVRESGTSYDSARVDSEVEMMSTDAVLIQAIKQLNLIQDPEFGVQFTLPQRLLGYLGIAQPELPTGDQALQRVMSNVRDAITIQRRGNTYVVSLGAQARDPDMSARLANALAEAYVDQQVGNKVDAALASRDIVQARIKQASESVIQSETAYDDFIFSNLGSTGDSELATLRDQIQSLTERGRSDRGRAILAEQSIARGDWKTVAEQLKDDAISKLERDRASLVQRLSTTPADVEKASLRTQLNELDQRLESAATTGLAGLRQQIDTYTSQSGELRQQLRTEALNSDLSPTVLASLYQLQQTAETARTQYSQLLSRVNELDSQAYLQVADSRIVSPATAPIEPSFPRPWLLLGFTGVVSLIAGLGLAVVMERYVGGFTSETQLEAVTRTPVVSAIPRWANDGGDVAASPHSAYAECVRRLRVAIDQLAHARGSRSQGATRAVVVAVTSTAPGEGKSSIAMALARSSTLAGRKALLIDCDLRKPEVNRRLGWPPSSAFSDYLKGTGTAVEPERLTAPDEASGATVIAGSRSASLLTDDAGAMSRLHKLIEHFRPAFDLIILDTPPVGPVADTVLLVPLADIVLFVVKWAGTPQGDVQAALRVARETKRTDAELLLVLNRQPPRGRYGGKYAGY